jgi:hypothetical protein
MIFDNHNWLLRRQFTMHSGQITDWKIECDGLTQEEIDTFAMITAQKFGFGHVVGVPTGGQRLAQALIPYTDPNSKVVLFVDDVLTTGASMDKMVRKPGDIGVVMFARGPCPDWVHPVFKLWG